MAEASSATGSSSKSSKKSSSVMPYAVGIAVAIALLLLWAKRSKAAGIDNPAPPPLDDGGLKPILYVNPIGPTADPTPPPVVKKSYTYRISGTSIDLTPGTLAASWGQTDTSAALQQLVGANLTSTPPLKNRWSLEVVFVGDTTGALDASRQSIVRDQDTAGSITVNPDTPAGFGYGQNPMPGFSGQWRGTGVRSPVISPWSAGQVVNIPAEWGDPPTRELEQNATVV